MNALLDTLIEGASQSVVSPPVRERALAALERSGLPREREEAWKYSSLKALRNRRFASGSGEAELDTTQLASLDLPDLNGPRVVVLNGRAQARYSRLDGLPAGLTVELQAHSEPSVEAALSRLDESSARGFVNLNAACATTVLRIRVDAGARIETPLHLVFATVADAQDLAAHLRVVIELGDGASLRLIEQWQGFGGAHLSTAVIQAALGCGANLRHLRVQEECEGASLIQSSETVLAAGASLRRYDIELGGGFVRHDLRVRLEGEDAASESFGVFALRGRQHVDTHLDVRHCVARTRSQSVWRGVVDERARGVFDGYIEIKAGADGSDAQLSNRNLLLSAHAEIDTRPVLEIHADDIKASHGVTVGQLDERALFYLRSRGVSLGEARRLLTYAFCREVFDPLQLEGLREHLAARLVDHLPEAQSRREEYGA